MRLFLLPLILFFLQRLQCRNYAIALEAASETKIKTSPESTQDNVKTLLVCQLLC